MSMPRTRGALIAAVKSNCTVQRQNGSFCDNPMAPEMPFPICSHHAIALYKRMTEIVNAATGNPQRLREIAEGQLLNIQAAQKEREKLCFIYYLRVGDMIKIGYTEQLTERLRQYPPGTKLLALERGGHTDEQRRHRQFDDYRTAGKEWYRIEQPLVDHINELRRLDGKKPLKLTDLQPAV